MTLGFKLHSRRSGLKFMLHVLLNALTAVPCTKACSMWRRDGHWSVNPWRKVLLHFLIIRDHALSWFYIVIKPTNTYINIYKYVILCYVMLCYVICFMLCYVMLCFMLCYVMFYVMFYVMLCYVMLCYVMLCYMPPTCFGHICGRPHGALKCLYEFVGFITISYSCISGWTP